MRLKKENKKYKIIGGTINLLILPLVFIIIGFIIFEKGSGTYRL
jgi:hypothetical protein